MEADESQLSKRALLAHLSQLLRLQISRLEQCANGAVYCQLVDAHFAGIVPMHKVNFGAKEEHEIWANYKVLQAAFVQLEITKIIDVPRLSKGNAADNLELLQWLFKYLKRTTIIAGYNAEHRRMWRKGGGANDVPVPSCLAANFDFKKVHESHTMVPAAALSPGSPASCSSGKNSHYWSSRDIVGGKVDVSHVVSRYKEGLAPPVPADRLRRRAQEAAGSSQRQASTWSSEQDVDGFSRARSSPSVSTQTEGPDPLLEDGAQSAYVDDGYGHGSPDGDAHRQDGVPLTPEDAASSRLQPALVDTTHAINELSAELTAVPAEVEVEGAISCNSEVEYAPNTSGLVVDATASQHEGLTLSTAAVLPEQQDEACRQEQGHDQEHSMEVGLSLLDLDTFQPDILRKVDVDAIQPGAAKQEAARDKLEDGPVLKRDLKTVQQEHHFTSAQLCSEDACAVARRVFKDEIATVPVAIPAASVSQRDADRSDNGSSQQQQRSTYEPAVHGHGLPPDAASLLYASVLHSRDLPHQSAGALADALAAAHDALDEVQRLLGCLQQHLEGPSQTAAHDLMLRGKMRSIMGAIHTVLEHTSLLLGDVDYLNDWQARSSGSIQQETTQDQLHGASQQSAMLAQQLSSLRNQFDGASSQLWERCSSPAISRDAGPDGMIGDAAKPHTPAFGQLLSTFQLDAVAKGVAQAQFGLMQAMHQRSAAMTASFLQSPAAEAAVGPSGTASTSRGTRCLRLGGLQLKKLRNGDVYQGHYHSGKKNGDGVYNFLNQDVYEGEFTADRMDGYGVYTFSHKGRYEGRWQAAVYSGYGTETFSMGSTYYGQYSAGLRNGCGACRFFNGDYYEGSWANGLREGEGMQQCTEDSNYVGEYLKGKRHGYGIYSFPNGDRYQGEYADDLPHGHGVYLFASGQKYEGEWSQGKKHGWSIYSVDNGHQFVGQWLDSKPKWIQAVKGSSSTQQDGGSRLAEANSSNEEIPEDIQELAEAARRRARAASNSALLCAKHHWTHTSPVLVASAVQGAAEAAAMAQAARRRAMDIAMKLNIAAVMQQ